MVCNKKGALPKPIYFIAAFYMISAVGSTIFFSINYFGITLTRFAVWVYIYLGTVFIVVASISLIRGKNWGRICTIIFITSDIFHKIVGIFLDLLFKLEPFDLGKIFSIRLLVNIFILLYLTNKNIKTIYSHSHIIIGGRG